MNVPTLRPTATALCCLVLCFATARAENAVVGSGSPASCTTAAYETALSLVVNDITGGQLSFNCGASPHTINIAGARNLQGQVIIDGGGRITLDAQDRTRFFVLSLDGPDGRTEVTLLGITLNRGNSGVEPFGGAILTRSGTALVLDAVTISNSLASVSGGAIANEQNTTLIVRNSHLTGNLAANGGAIASRARITISNSTFTNNNASGGEGGAIQSYEKRLTVLGSRFLGNGARAGGAIYKRDDHLEIADTNFNENSATQNGGAVHVVATPREPQLVRARMRGNTAGGAGGGLYTEAGVTVAASSFGGNAATRGGAVWVERGFISVIASNLHDNTARDAGGGIGVWEIEPSFPSAFQLMTTSGNTVTAGVGADLYLRSSAAEGATATIVRSTLMNAAASAAGSTLRVEGRAVAAVAASMLWPRAGSACSTVGDATVFSGGRNLRPAGCALTLSSDGTIASFESLGLGEFAHYGGTHDTFLPLPGSPAIDRLDEDFFNIDARGMPSPADGDGNGSAFGDIGAVERQRTEPQAAQFRDGFE